MSAGHGMGWVHVQCIFSAILVITSRRQVVTSSLHSPTAYEKSLLTLVLPSEFFFKTLATAISKSSCPTYCLRSRRAYIPDDVSELPVL